MAKSKRPLDHAYLTALRALTELLESTRTLYVIVGGLAVTLIAKPRFTEDIDAVVWLEPEVWPDMLEQARLHGFIPRSQRPLDFASQTNMLLLKHEGTEVEVDLSCGTLPFEREIIERAQTVELPDMTVRVATAEDLIVTKGVALREQDIADIRTVIEMNKTLDKNRIMYWLAQFAEVLERPEVYDTVKQMLEQPTKEKSSIRRKSRGRSR